MATTEQDMPNSVPWAMIPKKYAPNTKYGSNTVYTGVCVVETTNDYVTVLCACYANPPSTNPDYGLVYQSLSINVASGKRVMVMMDYYI